MKKTKGVNKGMPSAVLLSILIHAGLFLLAGMLVVFTVVRKDEQKFEPPQAVERPKMKLKKPKVKIKNTSKPKSTTRIVTKTARADMPDIQLPEMSGLGDGLGEGFGAGFDMMPELDEITIFGAGQTIGNDFIGTLYDFKRRKNGRSTGIDPESFLYELAKFTKKDWNKFELANYYQSPKKLYTTHFMIPTITSDLAPTAFGEPDMMGYAWIVHYEGQIVHPTGGTFRFWAQGDDVIIVRLNKRIVVDGSVSDSGSLGSFRQILTGYQNLTADNMKYYMGDRQAAVGEWFTLEPGVSMSMEVVIGESPGGNFSAMLAIEEKGVEYPTSPQGGPLLPMFKTEEPTHSVLDAIYEYLIPGEACCTNGPVFSDYASNIDNNHRRNPVPTLDDKPGAAPKRAGETSVRTWTMNAKKTIEAKYLCMIGGKVVLKTLAGKEVKVAPDQFSAEDMEYIELSNPPDLQVDFRYQSKQRLIATREAGVMGFPPTVLQWTFGAEVKQTSAGDYNHELNIQYFAIGQQVIDSNKYILLDRGQHSFIPSTENGRSHTFFGDTMTELWKFTTNNQGQGREYSGGLVVVTDKQGNVVEYSASKKWLWTHYDKLKHLPVGAFMDEGCTRVYPSGPKATRY